ncbi:uncharacterized protein LY79DRAFT_224460 [Colletotrichum navitas]|uniref:Uncharacterized protein n=1 Tax=Colletotrichum navitas TaxID=681940 RepID=A0AAD8PZY2_9PEZI|nr:uncharacterized protein LY79DRAFT_224460 [Colletotrichum navitas]KAK1590202.1 hypothetical protein LY79DRAFT_224460 [Colletotrichum navitas]
MCRGWARSPAQERMESLYMEGFFEKGIFQPSSPSAHSSSSTKDHQHQGNRRCISRLRFDFYLFLFGISFWVGKGRRSHAGCARPPSFNVVCSQRQARARTTDRRMAAGPLFLQARREKTGYGRGEQDGAGVKGNRETNWTQRNMEMGHV